MGLTRETLSGMFAFVPVPWTEDFDLDEATMRSDLEYLCSTDITGVYATDSTGEFFALEFDEYRAVLDAVVEVAHEAGKPIQANCVWTNERGALRRARYAVDRGVDAIRFAFPYWEDLTVEESFGFLERLANVCGDVPLVHYNSFRSAPIFSAKEYRRALEVAPTLIGAKLTQGSPLQLVEIIDGVPELQFFVGEPEFASMMAAGAEGSYSWLATMQPTLAVEWYEACETGDWDRAMEIQQMVWRWRRWTFEHWSVSTDAGYNKLDARINPNYDFHPRVRPPYSSGTLSDVEAGRAWARTNAPELVAEPVL